MNDEERIDAEWLAVNAFRGATKIATKSDMRMGTYDHALELGGELYPALLGEDVSLLRRERESDISKEYRQKARLKALKDGIENDPLRLIRVDIEELEGLLQVAKSEKNTERVDQLKKRLAILIKGRKELDPSAHSEHQLIFRDATSTRDDLKSLSTGKGYRDFELPEKKVLRVRVLHPDHPEHVTGADIVYERHDTEKDLVSIVAVQYKIWNDRRLYLSDPRMQDQLSKMKQFLCDKKKCDFGKSVGNYRFPCCAAFLRPTDKLQNPNQKLVSRGEHIPICRIENCQSIGERGAKLLEYEHMRKESLPAEVFEHLFNSGQLGSDWMQQDELYELYGDALLEASADRVVVYVQEFEAKD